MDLMAQIALLDALTQEAVQLGQRHDDERRIEIIKFRKAQALQIGVISKAAYHFDFAAIEDGLDVEFRKKMSYLKSVIAQHQSDWPVPMIEARSRAYRQSGDKMNVTQSDFVAWAMRKLR